jgi:hypothetical protein
MPSIDDPYDVYWDLVAIDGKVVGVDTAEEKKSLNRKQQQIFAEDRDNLVAVKKIMGDLSLGEQDWLTNLLRSTDIHQCRLVMSLLLRADLPRSSLKHPVVDIVVKDDGFQLLSKPRAAIKEVGFVTGTQLFRMAKQGHDSVIVDKAPALLKTHGWLGDSLSTSRKMRGAYRMANNITKYTQLDYYEDHLTSAMYSQTRPSRLVGYPAFESDDIAFAGGLDPGGPVAYFLCVGNEEGLSGNRGLPPEAQVGDLLDVYLSGHDIRGKLIAKHRPHNMRGLVAYDPDGKTLSELALLDAEDRDFANHLRNNAVLYGIYKDVRYATTLSDNAMRILPPRPFRFIPRQVQTRYRNAIKAWMSRAANYDSINQKYYVLLRDTPHNNELMTSPISFLDIDFDISSLLATARDRGTYYNDDGTIYV